MTETTITLNGTLFQVKVQESPRRRTLAIEIIDAQTLVVRLPKGGQVSWRSEVERHTGWILRHAARFRRLASERPLLEKGGWGWVLGEKRSVNVDPDGPVGSDQEEIRAWYRKAAAGFLRRRLERWSQTLQISYTRMRLSDATGRWGYCRSDGVIGLNWRLYQAPLMVIDYVVVHELTHRHHAHHQQAFWAELSLHYPGASEARRWLKEYGPMLIW